MSRRGWALFVAMCFIWGIPYLLIKVSVGELTPSSLVLLRTGLSAAVLLPIAAARGMLRPLLPRWRPLLAYTVAELAVPWFLLSAAEQRLTSSLTGLLVAAVPLVGVALGLLAGSHERLGVRRLAGLLLGLAGVAALVGLDVRGTNVVAVVEVLIVAVGYALGPLILSRRLADLPSLGVVSASLALTAVGYLPVGVAQLPDRMPAGRVVLAVLVLAILCSAIAFLIFFALIAEVGPVRATVITYVNPAVAVALGVVLLHEPFTAGIAVGFLLVLTGSALATARAPGQGSDRRTPVAVAEP